MLHNERRSPFSGAKRRTSIASFNITIITVFDRLPNEAITATGGPTGAGAIIGINTVSIVAALDPNLDDPIATNRFAAGIGALVLIDIIAVVADLGPFDEAISTNGQTRRFFVAAHKGQNTKA